MKIPELDGIPLVDGKVFECLGQDRKLFVARRLDARPKPRGRQPSLQTAGGVLETGDGLLSADISFGGNVFRQASAMTLARIPFSQQRSVPVSPRNRAKPWYALNNVSCTRSEGSILVRSLGFNCVRAKRRRYGRYFPKTSFGSSDLGVIVSPI